MEVYLFFLEQLSKIVQFFKAHLTLCQGALVWPPEKVVRNTGPQYPGQLVTILAAQAEGMHVQARQLRQLVQLLL